MTFIRLYYTHKKELIIYEYIWAYHHIFMVYSTYCIIYSVVQMPLLWMDCILNCKFISKNCCAYVYPHHTSSIYMNLKFSEIQTYKLIYLSPSSFKDNSKCAMAYQVFCIIFKISHYLHCNVVFSKLILQQIKINHNYVFRITMKRRKLIMSSCTSHLYCIWQDRYQVRARTCPVCLRTFSHLITNFMALFNTNTNITQHKHFSFIERRRLKYTSLLVSTW